MRDRTTATYEVKDVIIPRLIGTRVFRRAAPHISARPLLTIGRRILRRSIVAVICSATAALENVVKTEPVSNYTVFISVFRISRVVNSLNLLSCVIVPSPPLIPVLNGIKHPSPSN